MPEFPRHHSERSLTTQQPRAMRDDADIRTDAAERNKIAGQAIADVSDTMTKWQASVEKIQADTAMYNFKAGMLEINNEATLDPDITAEAKYQKRVQDLRKTVTGGIDNKGLINQMSPELNYLSNVGALGIQQEFRKKTIIHGQKIVLDDLSLLANNPTDLTESAIEKRIGKSVTDGIYGEVEGLKLEQKYKAEARENMFIQDLNNDPATTEKKLLKNAYGFDVDELENAGKIYERELQVIRNNTEEDLIDMSINGTLTEDIVLENRKLGKIDANFAKSTIKDLNTVTVPKVEALESVTQQNILAEKYNALKSKEWGWKNASFDERTQFRADVFKAKTKGWIDQKLFEDYLSKSKDKFFSDPVFQNAMSKVFQTSNEYATSEDRGIAKAQMTKDLMRKVGDGMPPADALQSVITERIETDFPGYKAEDLILTSRETGLSIQAVYDLLQKKKGKVE